MNKTADTFGGLPFLLCWTMTDMTDRIATSLNHLRKAMLYAHNSMLYAHNSMFYERHAMF